MMEDQTLMTFDEWRALSAESRARINAYGLEMERLQAELKKRQWIPVTERLPRIGEEVIALSGGYVGVGYIAIDRDWIMRTLTYSPVVTHWMPLPEPPRDGE